MNKTRSWFHPIALCVWGNATAAVIAAMTLLYYDHLFPALLAVLIMQAIPVQLRRHGKRGACLTQTAQP